MTDEINLLTRRRAMKAGAVAIAGGAAAGGGLWYSSQAVLAAHADGWNADDPGAVETHDGTIDDVVLSTDTEVSIDWANLAEDGQEARIRIWARPDPDSFDDPTWSTITEGTVTLEDMEGHETFQMSDWQSSIDGGSRSFVEEHPDIERSDFEPDDEGETEETTIELSLDVEITDGADDGLSASPDNTSFTTTVTWIESEMSTGGDAEIDVQV